MCQMAIAVNRMPKIRCSINRIVPDIDRRFKIGTAKNVLNRKKFFGDTVFLPKIYKKRTENAIGTMHQTRSPRESSLTKSSLSQYGNELVCNKQKTPEKA